MRFAVYALFASAMPALCLADPVGRYSIEGTNPGSSGIYKGTAVVSRDGETYRVVWKIGKDETIGIGIGGHVIDGQLQFGPASSDDTALSIAYGSGDTFGNAVYALQQDGTWRGTWVYNGGKQVATETWTSTNRPSASENERDDNVAIDADPQTVKPLRSRSSPLPAAIGPKS